MPNLGEVNTKIELALDQLKRVRDDLAKIDAKLERDYVTQEAFTPVRNIVYGLVGLILVGVVTALLALVIMK